MRAIVRVAAFALAHLPTMALAQDGPSYEETVEFIQAKTMVTEEHDESSFVYQIQETNHCQFVLLSRQVGTKENDAWRLGPIANERMFFDLSEFDPSRVEINRWHITINSTENRNVTAYEHEILPESFANFRACISGESDFANYQKEGRSCRMHQKEWGSSVVIQTFNGDTNAPKLQRAFQHLIRLCGGEEELF